jgi:DNA-binding transcriptional LysR family regulator
MHQKRRTCPMDEQPMRYLPETEAIFSFAVLAEERNFRRAAERLGIDHSALSRRIRDLERRIGFTLFERTTREVKITEAGKLFRIENDQLLTALRRSIASARLVAEGVAGRIRIGYMSFAAAKLLPEAIARFKRLRPNVAFELIYLRSHGQKEALSRGEIDVGLMIGPWHSDAFAARTVSRERLCAYFAGGMALEDEGGVTLAGLSRQPLIMGTYEQWDLYRWMLDDLFFQKGIVPAVALEASSITGILGLVRAGLGASIFPECAAALCPVGIKHRILEDCDIPLETICVTPRRPSALIEEFVDRAFSSG